LHWFLQLDGGGFFFPFVNHFVCRPLFVLARYRLATILSSNWPSGPAFFLPSDNSLHPLLFFFPSALLLSISPHFPRCELSHFSRCFVWAACGFSRMLSLKLREINSKLRHKRGPPTAFSRVARVIQFLFFLLLTVGWT